MKKVLAIVLVLTLFFGLSTVALAVGSATGSTTSSERTSSLPVVTSDMKEKGVKLTAWENKANLSETAQKDLKDAKASVKEEAPDGAAVRYLFYAEADEYPVDVTTTIKGIKEANVKLYNDGTWSDLSSSLEGTALTFTLKGPGAVAIFTK